MGTSCAMTTCRVEAKAWPTTAGSRALRVAVLALPLQLSFLRLGCIWFYSTTGQDGARVPRKEWGGSCIEQCLKAGGWTAYFLSFPALMVRTCSCLLRMTVTCTSLPRCLRRALAQSLRLVICCESTLVTTSPAFRPARPAGLW